MHVFDGSCLERKEKNRVNSFDEEAKTNPLNHTKATFNRKKKRAYKHYNRT